MLTRRTLLTTSAAASATAATSGLIRVPASADSARRPFLPYTSTSYFRQPVSGRPVDRARTRAFRRFMAEHPDQRGVAHPRVNGVEGNPWGTPYAMGRAGDPVWRLAGDRIDPRARRLVEEGFVAPSWLGEVLTGTNDSPLCVVDRVNHFTMFCANAERVGRRTIRANYGAITFHGSNGLDHRHPGSDDDRNFTSRGRISDSMVIRRDLVDHGVRHGTDLGHVLQLFLVETRSADGFTGPMVGAEGGKHGFGAEGEHIAIAPGIDLRRRGLSPEGLVLARTLRRYGCYFGDNSGTASALKAEQESPGHPVWRGRLGRDVLAGLTWDDFVVLR